MELASTKASAEAPMEVVEDVAVVITTEASTEAIRKLCSEDSTEASTQASTKDITEASKKASTEASTKMLQRKHPRIQKLSRKNLDGILGSSSMEASGSFHGRS